jgi:hypothetical protein
MCKNYDQESDVPFENQAHTTRPDANDVAKVSATVLSHNILRVISGRCHMQHVNQSAPQVGHNKNKGVD